MSPTISTNHGDYHFSTVSLYHGRKIINRDIARENLLLLTEVLDQTSISWGIIYGTLLGAVREGDFIEHDEDTDLFVLHEDKSEFFDLLHGLREKGFEVGRYDGELLSLIRNDEYVDSYFFKKYGGKRQAGDYSVPRQFFLSRGTVSMFGKELPTVCEPHAFLEHTYGIDWQTPIKGAHAPTRPIWWKLIIRKIRASAREKMPWIHRIYKAVRR